jgi:hypothetical protein
LEIPSLPTEAENEPLLEAFNELGPQYEAVAARVGETSSNYVRHRIEALTTGQWHEEWAAGAAAREEKAQEAGEAEKTGAAEKFDESAAVKRLEKAKHYQCSDERKFLWEDGEDIPPLLRQNLCRTAKSIELLEASSLMTLFLRRLSQVGNPQNKKMVKLLTRKFQRPGTSNVATSP